MSDRFQVMIPITTPYDERGDVDARALRGHAQALAEAGVDGFFVAGSTGEGPLLSDEEVVGAVRIVREAVDGLQVIAQVGRPGTRATRELLVGALAAGADAAAAVTPYYYDLAEQQALHHYGQLIDAAAPAPLYGYVIPWLARNDLPAAAIGELAGRGLAGLKDSTRSLERHREYHAAAPEGFRIFVGDASLTLAAHQLGSAGVIPALGNWRPELFVQLASAADGGDIERASETQRELARALQELRASGRTLKQAVAETMARRGIAYRAAARGPL